MRGRLNEKKLGVLITGGAGFIGSYLAEEHLKKGDRVLVIDDLSTGFLSNITHLKTNSRFSFYHDTIMNKALMEKLIKEVDIIYHLAAAVGVKYVMEDPLGAIETNIRGTEIVLELASQKKRKVILASSSEIYGKNKQSRLSEDDDGILGSTKITRWSYACSKAMDEFMAFAYFKKKGLPIVIIRFFNICGPRQTGRYGMVVPRFIEQALSNKPLTVYGDGNQVRSFAYITDAIKTTMELANHPQAVGEIFNVGSSEATTILGLAQRIKRLTGSRSEIVFIPYEEAYEEGFEDMVYRVPEITKLRNLLSYSPKFDLETMLIKIIEYRKRENQKKGIHKKSYIKKKT